MTAKYNAFIQQNGHTELAGTDSNKGRLKAAIRRRYGKGCKAIVMIEKIVIDGDGISWFEPVTVEKFTLRS